jgi:hypothetical protein
MSSRYSFWKWGFHGHSEFEKVILIKYHPGNRDEVTIPESLKKRKRGLLGRRENKYNPFRRQQHKSEKVKCLALHYYSYVGQCISREILMTKGAGWWKEQNRKMEEDNQQSELEERGEELRRSEITKKLEATIQKLRTKSIFGRLSLTRLVWSKD